MEANTKKISIIFAQKLIAGYKLLISLWLGNRCRFTPTCSEYAHQALEQHGLIKGTLYSLKRITRCHPWGAAGHDPVPESDRPSINNATVERKSH